MLRSSFAIKLALIIVVLAVVAAVAGDFPWGPI